MSLPRKKMLALKTKLEKFKSQLSCENDSGRFLNLGTPLLLSRGTITLKAHITATWKRYILLVTWI